MAVRHGAVSAKAKSHILLPQRAINTIAPAKHGARRNKQKQQRQHGEISAHNGENVMRCGMAALAAAYHQQHFMRQRSWQNKRSRAGAKRKWRQNKGGSKAIMASSGSVKRRRLALKISGGGVAAAAAYRHQQKRSGISVWLIEWQMASAIGGMAASAAA
jgi:hypothetical protein